MKTGIKSLGILVGVALVFVGAQAFGAFGSNTFDNAASVQVNSPNYNPPPISARFDYGAFTPQLTANALWTRDADFDGGGYFFKDGTMLLNHLFSKRVLHPAYRLPENLEVKTMETYEDESMYMSNKIYFRAMLRDGWEFSNNSPQRNL